MPSVRSSDSEGPGAGAAPGPGPQLWDEFFQGSRVACARLISLVEDRPDLVPGIRDRLIPRQKGAVRIGITGPPGVGKSTVTAALARRAVAAGHAVGVIAVDPSSPFTGGAFLGDRVRMQGLLGHDRVFIRSMASRAGHGGLSPATPYAAEVFDAFGMDRIFIETVGVGQAELDVLTCVDLIVLVLQPGTGDVIQALKAGIIEAADLLLVNKSDLPGTESLLDALRFLYEIGARPKDTPAPPVLTASALQNQGLDEVFAGVEQLIHGHSRSGRFRDKQRQRLQDELRAAILQDLWDRFSALTEAPEELRSAAEELLENGRSPYPFIRAMSARVRMEIEDERT
jgi:LAO/AO transport system kinase